MYMYVGTNIYCHSPVVICERAKRPAYHNNTNNIIEWLKATRTNVLGTFILKLHNTTIYTNWYVDLDILDIYLYMFIMYILRIWLLNCVLYILRVQRLLMVCGIVEDSLYFMLWFWCTIPKYNNVVKAIIFRHNVSIYVYMYALVGTNTHTHTCIHMFNAHTL